MKCSPPSSMCLYLNVPQWINVERFGKAINSTAHQLLDVFDVSLLLLLLNCQSVRRKPRPPAPGPAASNVGVSLPLSITSASHQDHHLFASAYGAKKPLLMSVTTHASAHSSTNSLHSSLENQAPIFQKY